jgi:hypothetical protein
LSRARQQAGYNACPARVSRLPHGRGSKNSEILGRTFTRSSGRPLIRLDDLAGFVQRTANLSSERIG